MHYHAEVWVSEDPTGNEESILNDLMGPSEEDDNGYWDWFVHGGRWTGAHDGYEPANDIRNYEVCDLCHGTGQRTDGDFTNDPVWVEQSRGCNSCAGTGAKRSWENAPHDGDTMALDSVKQDLDCFTLVVEGHGTYHSEVWDSSKQEFQPGEFTGLVKPFLASLNVSGGYLITVDYHC